MIITNIGKLLTMKPGPGRKGPLGIVENCSVEIKNGKISSVIASEMKQSPGQTIDAKGRVVLPGLVECHSHLVFAGSRADEFAMRARGATYQEIARAGGGIMSTVRATRAASEDELFRTAKGRAKEAMAFGITTIEVKSGYGLDLETELKMLRVVKKLNKELPIDFVPTFLAHMIPKDHPLPNPPPSRGRGVRDGFNSPLPLRERARERGEYVDHLINTVLPAVAKQKLAEFCDVFVESIAFTKAEAEKIFKVAKKLGLKLKLHADQMSQNGGALLAARLKAVSADHLEFASEGNLKKMSRSGTVAVLIPSSTFFIDGEYAKARKMIDLGVDVAISTDFNPGTSPILNLWLAGTMAITQMKLTPEEVYQGITINAAKALGLEKTVGSIEKGKSADLIILDTKNEFDPFYRFDKNFVNVVIKKGEKIWHTRTK